MSNLQPASHPLMWAYLVSLVEEYGMTNPEVWIEDVRRFGPPTPEKRDTVCKDTGDETDILEASFSVIGDHENNRIIIRTHY